MRTRHVLLAPATGGFFYDDQAAIRSGAVKDGERYLGRPATPGFPAVRIPASAVSIGLVLESGFVAWGDAMSVQYPGVAGRDVALDADRELPPLRRHLVPWLVGRDVVAFRENAAAVCALSVEGRPLHAGIRYGVTQALLAAAAHAAGVSMAERICAEYGVPLAPAPVPIYTQSGDERYRSVDRMILKGADVLPHGLINNAEKFGCRGEAFLEYVGWVVERVRALGPPGYHPTLHFDVYGMAGVAFDRSVERIADYLGRVERAAGPFTVRVESPADFGSLAAQMERCAELRRRLRARGCAVQLVMDEWCNTLADLEACIAAAAADMVQIKMPDLGGLQESIAAVLRCRQAGVGAFLGGSCTETACSARASVHVAVATQPAMQLAKPGMGVDEGLMLVRNEQSRLLAEIEARRQGLFPQRP